jgi:uncharacterized Rossmann fold enzyme
MGYDIGSDEASARLLAALTQNSDLISEEELAERIGDRASVLGGADSLPYDIERVPLSGTVVAAGSFATATALAAGIVPDILVTDLDGDMPPQLEASRCGAVVIIHAHGDNEEAIRTYAGSFTGPMMITTQSVPHGPLFDFGGFTDGDRAVCLLRHFGVRDISLYGFDFEHPSVKDGSDRAVKLKKLSWAKHIIFDNAPAGEHLVRI